MPSLRLGVTVTALYGAVIALGTYIAFKLIEPLLDLPHALLAVMPVQIIAIAAVIIVLRPRVSWAGIGFCGLNWAGLVWLAPASLVLLLMGWSVFQSIPAGFLTTTGVPAIALILATALLIAFGEEIVFRGVLLRGALRDLPVAAALFLSAACFAVLHLVNGVVGQTASGTIQQVAFALIVGIALAPIAVRLQNLWPLIIWHSLWNITVFASQLADVVHPFVGIGMAMQAVVSVWLWVQLVKAKGID